MFLKGFVLAVVRLRACFFVETGVFRDSCRRGFLPGLRAQNVGFSRDSHLTAIPKQKTHFHPLLITVALMKRVKVLKSIVVNSINKLRCMMISEASKSIQSSADILNF